jgi:putative nucleotidyltransferase with HDIG domain
MLTPQEMMIAKLFPEIEKIGSEDLKKKTIRCVQMAMDEGKWKMEDLMQMPFTLLVLPCPVSFVQHTRAVSATARAIGLALKEQYPNEPRMQPDMDTLLSGAVLHDIGKPLEYARGADGKWTTSECGKALRHPVSGAALAREAGLPYSVQHIIAAHSWEGDKCRHGVEAIIVHHADFINFEPIH